ncbi:MAG: hypothetical protein Q8O67_18635 [Deltaproteobacteria bacterium]|nr:hypothetical protein [Deltaproteobacteria bacterium]
MKIHEQSHLDHGLTAAHLRWIEERFGDRVGFFKETVEMPAHLEDLPCALFGPAAGDPPVLEAEVHHAARGVRTWTSRLVQRSARMTRLLTVIAGPVDDDALVLLTAFGGPLAPQEPGDPRCRDLEESTRFWREHALADSG